MNNWLFSEGFLIDNCIYFFTDDEYIFGRYSISENKLFVQKELKSISKAYRYIDRYIVFGNHIYAPTINGESLLVIDSANWKVEVHRINANGESWGNYSEIEVYENKIFLFCRKLRKIVIFDTNTSKVEEIELPFKADFGKTIDGVTWLFSEDSHSFIRFSLHDLTYKIVYSTNEIKDIAHIVAYKKTIIILSRSGDIYFFNTLTHCLDDVYKSNEYRNVGRLVVTDYVLIELPSLGRDIYFIERNLKKCRVYSSYPKDFEYIGDEGWSKYKGIIECFDKYILTPRSSNYIMFIDKKTGEISWEKPEMPEKFEMIAYYIGYDGIVHENSLKLPDLVEYVVK